MKLKNELNRYIVKLIGAILLFAVLLFAIAEIIIYETAKIHEEQVEISESTEELFIDEVAEHVDENELLEEREVKNIETAELIEYMQPEHITDKIENMGFKKLEGDDREAEFSNGKINITVRFMESTDSLESILKEREECSGRDIEITSWGNDEANTRAASYVDDNGKEYMYLCKDKTFIAICADKENSEGIKDIFSTLTSRTEMFKTLGIEAREVVYNTDGYNNNIVYRVGGNDEDSCIVEIGAIPSYTAVDMSGKEYSSYETDVIISEMKMCNAFGEELAFIRYGKSQGDSETPVEFAFSAIQGDIISIGHEQHTGYSTYDIYCKTVKTDGRVYKHSIIPTIKRVGKNLTQVEYIEIVTSGNSIFDANFNLDIVLFSNEEIKVLCEENEFTLAELSNNMVDSFDNSKVVNLYDYAEVKIEDIAECDTVNVEVISNEENLEQVEELVSNFVHKEEETDKVELVAGEIYTLYDIDFDGAVELAHILEDLGAEVHLVRESDVIEDNTVEETENTEVNE